MIVAQKLSGAFFLWMFKYFLWCTFFQNAAFIHEDDMVRNLFGKCHLMGYDDHGRISVCQFFHDTQNLSGEFRVKSRGRLVKA